MLEDGNNLSKIKKNYCDHVVLRIVLHEECSKHQEINESNEVQFKKDFQTIERSASFKGRPHHLHQKDNLLVHRVL